VQLLYDMPFTDGEKLAQDPRLAAIAFTGSRQGGLKLKAAADAVGKPIFLELGSINPVLILPGALAEKGAALSEEFTTSCLMATGQFCTSPGMLLLQADAHTEAFVDKTVNAFTASPNGLLFSEGGCQSLAQAVKHLNQAGAQILTGGTPVADDERRYTNTVLRVSGAEFLANSQALQAEAFGNATLIVVASDQTETLQILDRLEGNLTGSIYSASDGSDDDAYNALAPALRQRVGRMLNDKMPTGVAVSPAMNHGGPFPATAQAAFSAVGMPGALLRFAMLQCYDNVRPERLPAGLRDENPHGLWRQIDGQWTKDSL
jgi:NADP-dependent aldehyde dehydrogenase